MPNVLDGAYRYDVVRLLDRKRGNVGVELGVAAGGFSARMVESGYFDLFIGIDRYRGVHDVDEYKLALKRLGLGAPYKLLRMTFDEALDLFEDESLDFIYIDGYAHTGEQGGQTIHDWARKVKIGGVIAGDDYHPDWPLVVEVVDYFVRTTGFALNVTGKVEAADYAHYPSWAVVKTHAVEAQPSSALMRRGKRAAAWAEAKGAIRNPFRNLAKRLLGPKAIARLKRR